MRSGSDIRNIFKEGPSPRFDRISPEVVLPRVMSLRSSPIKDKAEKTGQKYVIEQKKIFQSKIDHIGRWLARLTLLAVMSTALFVFVALYRHEKSYLIKDFSLVPMLAFFGMQFVVYFVLWPLTAILATCFLRCCI